MYKLNWSEMRPREETKKSPSSFSAGKRARAQRRFCQNGHTKGKWKKVRVKEEGAAAPGHRADR